jgi:hypothetical protein
MFLFSLQLKPKGENTMPNKAKAGITGEAARRTVE